MKEQFVYSQKNNFSGGELTPTIEGRTELGLYQNGVKKLINFMLLPSGGIMRRHGTKFVHLFEENVPKKMVSVMFSRQLSYLLVFESHKLKTTCSFFVGGELFLTSKVLKDNGLANGNDFHFRPRDFSYCCFQGVAYISFGSNRPIFKFSVDPEIIDKFYQHIKEQGGLREEAHGERPEIASIRALEYAANFPDKDRMFIIEPLKCHVNYFKAAQNNNRERPFNEVIYNAEVDRINDELRLIHGAAGQNIYERQQEELYCSSVVTFENRLWCFGVNKNIHGIWASYKGDFSDFRMAYKTLLEARNPLTAFSATFSSSTFDNVLWSIPFSNELLLGTTDGIYLVKEGDRAKGEFVKIHKEIEIPVSPIKPVILGKTIFFVEGNGCKINSLFYSQEKGGFQIADITAYAEHIFAAGIRQITGSNSPFSIVFAVLKNGSFATFTYSGDLKIMGWSQHWLGGEAGVLSITPIYADNEDRMYFHVRRAGGLDLRAKEYIEVLMTRYFSAKSFEMQKPVYADCYVDILASGENAIYHSILQAIKDDTAHEFRGGITKLEHMTRASAESIMRLDIQHIDNIEIGQKFKYKNKLVSEYQHDGDNEHAVQIIEFLKRYYKDYLRIIMETLGLNFAYLRIFTSIYAELENVFSGEPEKLAKVEQLFYDGERLGGDIIKTITEIVQHWELPQILQDGGLMEYLPNNAFSFYLAICLELKTFNTELIVNTANLVKEIITAAKPAINGQFEQSLELRELRSTAANINKRLLLYYADIDNGNRQDLLLNLKKFFEQRSIDFYPELLNIAHPTLTRYLFGEKVKQLVNENIEILNQNATQDELKNTITPIINQLMIRLNQILQEQKIDEIASFKRRAEITEVLRNLVLEKQLNQAAREYVLSQSFTEDIDNIIYAQIDLLLGAGLAADEEKAEAMEEVKDDEQNVESEEDEEEVLAIRTNQQMQGLKDSLADFQSSIIELAGFVMPNQNQLLLKDILEDEKTIKLEKYLLLSKKYFPVFKKMFPDIGDYELSVIARNCMPSFQQLKLEGILPIFQKMAVNIIGDEELHSNQILSDELVRLKHPVRHLSIGFPYSSVLKTFPFIFPDEVEHAPKGNVEFGLKLFNTKGGHIEEKLANGQIEKQYINSKYIDSDALIRLVNEKKYLATKQVCDILSTPYQSGWVNFISQSEIKTDVDFTFIVDRPYPASILKIYSKAKILPNYKGMDSYV